MTPKEIARKHIDLWLAEDPSEEHSHTLTQRVLDAITESLAVQAQEHRDAVATLQHESGVLRAVKAACNYDVSGDSSPETTVRRLWHEREDMKAKIKHWMDEYTDMFNSAGNLRLKLREAEAEHEAYVAMMHDKGP